MNLDLKKPASLMSFLITLTFTAVMAQISFFLIHYNVSDLFDSFVKSSLKLDCFHFAILAPIVLFITIQCISFFIFIIIVWFTTKAVSDLFHLNRQVENMTGLGVWSVAIAYILCLNSYYYPHSFFAFPVQPWILGVLSTIVSLLLLAGMVNFFYYRRHLASGIFLAVLTLMFLGCSLATKLIPTTAKPFASKQPNIIFIGLDSVRPDFVGFLGGQHNTTPHIDSFLKSSVVFKEAYTPLARTFPSWMTILTGKYPKHSQARTNLADPALTLSNDTLALHLQAAGYETVYATDEKRFSNIIEGYGFDRIIGPGMGVNDFVLGGLNDFPLSNLLTNSTLGRFLFPYNFGNRAAAITYEPERFLEMVKLGLAQRTQKPLFLSIHLCISHWPFTWARDNQHKRATLPQQYEHSVVAVDKQLGDLLGILKTNGLLQNALVVLLSDHGTTVGLPNDRIINEAHYQGDKSKLKLLPTFKLSSAQDYSLNFKKDYNISTSYGQGTDVLSLKQYHVLLAMKSYGFDLPTKSITDRVLLLDIAPTILDFFHYQPLKNIDGISLVSYLKNAKYSIPNRAFFLETGYSLSDIESKTIIVEKVLKQAIGLYKINPANGMLYINPETDKAVNANKQRAVLLGEWLLARYPAATIQKLAFPKGKLSQTQTELKFEKVIQPSFYVIANIKTGRWDIGLDSPLAKQAATQEMLKQFELFYGKELIRKI